MAVYGPVRHQKHIIWISSPKAYDMDLRSFGPNNIFFGDGPVNILPYDPQCHEIFSIYTYRHISIISNENEI
jgi:hypothetical protein